MHIRIGKYIYIHIYINVHTQKTYIYIYIYIYNSFIPRNFIEIWYRCLKMLFVNISMYSLCLCVCECG